MKKLIAVLLCLVNVFALLSCEKTETEADETIKNIETTSSENSKENHTPKQYFKLEQKGFGYYYEIYDKQGDVVLAKESSRPTEITMLGETIVDIKIGMGTGLAVHTYYDVEGNRFSEEYTYVAAASGNLVAYVDVSMKDPMDHRKLVVRDIFDKTAFYKSFGLDFAPAVDTPIESAVFTENENELEVVYLSERPATPHSITIPIRRGASEGEKLSEEERAMKEYGEALNSKINVYDPVMQDYSLLKDYRTPYNRIPLCEVGSLGYVFMDVDGDMSNELVLDCGDTIILRYYEGTVYVYSFTFRNLYHLKTDGSYAWNHTGENFEYGEDTLYFEGAECKSKELYRIVNDGEPNAEYYIDGKQVTQEEILKYMEDNPKTKVEFVPLEVSWLNKISHYEALSIASEYWERYDIEANGYHLEIGTNKSAPSSVHVVLIRRFVIDHYSTFDEIWIDKNTGDAIIPYVLEDKG